jgi:hypothetical protein
MQALLDLQLAYVRYCMRDEVAARHHLSEAFTTDATLATDAAYFAEWLRSCEGALAPPASSSSFGAWVSANLPRDVDPRVAQRRTGARRSSNPDSRGPSGAAYGNSGR